MMNEWRSIEMERDKLVHQDYLQVLNYYKKMTASGIKYFLHFYWVLLMVVSLASNWLIGFLRDVSITAIFVSEFKL